MNRIALVFGMVLLLCAPRAFAESVFSNYLDTEAIGAASWKDDHPRLDGRGVVIAVLDTGVDMGVPGLKETSTGEVKFIEARDFTGEAVVECKRASFETGDDGRDVWRVDGGWLTGIGLPENSPKEGDVFLGFLDESRFRNAGVTDLNGNGRTDDRFGIVLERGTDDEWTMRVDLDGDKDIGEGPIIRSFEDSHAPFRLQGYDPSRGLAPVSIAAHIMASDNGEKKVEFHIPTGSHGTHVAGIAGGYRLNGREGFDGIAPGARMLSLKIGDNRLSGGCTVTESMKKALEFAANWGREHGVPVVVNMSYGIGSELEGKADIEQFVDRLVEDNPHLVPVFSAGNSGPGLSTVGSPAAALHAISVAAAYTPGNSRDLLGGNDKSVKLFHFSARGGELAKPDVTAPGIASSTVPYWSKYDLMRGTSMASPQVAGAVALVLSALSDKAVAWNSGMVKRAFTESARPIKGYSPLDVGGGMANVKGAFKALQGISGERHANHVVNFQVTADTPTSPGGEGTAVYWRTDGWAPDAARPTKVRVKTRFNSGAPGLSKADYYRSFSLSADAGWVNMSKGSIYLKGEHEADFNLWIDRGAVAEPGVHTATVRGRSGRQGFRFPVTVVTPHRPTTVAGVPTLAFDRLKMRPSEVRRLPFTVPPGVSTVEVSAVTSTREKASLYVYLFDLQGRRVPVKKSMVASEEGAKATFKMTSADYLGPGTYELVLYAVPTARYTNVIDLDVRFFSLDAEPIRSLDTEAGRPPRVGVDVTNRMDVPFTGSAKGSIVGYEKLMTRKVDGDELIEGFHASREVERVEFEITMSPQDYARFTDVAVNILDHDGKALVKTGFTSRVARLTLDNQSPGKKEESDYRLEVRAGKALGGGSAFNLSIAARYILRDKVELFGTVDGQRRFSLYPTVTTGVEFKASGTPKSPPSGTTWHGYIDFVNARDSLTWLRVPIKARP